MVLLLALNILNGFDLKALGFNSPEYLHVVTEAMELAFADRDQDVADPRFTDVPVSGLLSRSYAAARRELIRRDRAVRGIAPPGDPRHTRALAPGGRVVYEAEPQEMRGDTAARSGLGETSSFSIADRFGNLVSVTQSVNGTFGSGIVVDGAGFVLNNRLPCF